MALFETRLHSLCLPVLKLSAHQAPQEIEVREVGLHCALEFRIQHFHQPGKPQALQLGQEFPDSASCMIFITPKEGCLVLFKRAYRYIYLLS